MALIPARGMYSRMKELFVDSKPSNETSTSLTTFTKFPDLPPEMRFKILKIVAHQPRILEIKMYGNNWDRENRSGFVCNVPVPAILHVNQETRRECLKYYQPRLGIQLESRIYFNNVSDTILLPHVVLEPLCHHSIGELAGDVAAPAIQKEFRHILHLALCSVDGIDRPLSNFPKLASILGIAIKPLTLPTGYATGRAPGDLREVRFDQLLQIEESHESKRNYLAYSKRLLLETVQRCYGPEGKHPIVELMVDKAVDKDIEEFEETRRRKGRMRIIQWCLWIVFLAILISPSFWKFVKGMLGAERWSRIASWYSEVRDDYVVIRARSLGRAGFVELGAE